VADLLMVAVVVAFFGICIAYVSLCDKVIGPDPENLSRADAWDRHDVEDEVTSA